MPLRTGGASFLLNVPSHAGYAVVQTLGGKDTAYEALNVVIKAARAAIDGYPVGVAIPLIVLGGSHYNFGYDEDGKENLEPVVRCLGAPR